MAWVGLDIGTSAVKAVVVDDRETPLLQAERPLTTQRPGPHLSEQDAQSWLDAVFDLLDAWAHEHPAIMAQVAGLGLSGQMHGAVCLGADAKPLLPVILWNDGRAAPEAAELNARYPKLAWKTGVPATPGFTAPKLLWLARHRPALFEAVRTVLLPKDYVRLALTGDMVTDMSDAAGSWWLDQARRDWCEEALEATGISRAMLPALVEGSAPSGVIRPELTRRWGMSGRVVVAGGAGDAMAGAIGVGAVEDGPFLSLGTSAQLFAPGKAYRPLPDQYLHAYCHAAPGRWAQVAALLNGASCLAWAADLLGEPIEKLLAEVAQKPAGPGEILFLPYLTGERTPHNDAEASGGFIGLTPSSGKADLIRAVLEGVAYSFADAAECLRAAGGTLEAAAIIGGGARSPLWVQILADVLAIPLTRFRGGEKGPAFGAARLARAAATGVDIAEIATAPPVLDVTQPRPALSEAYGAKVAAFRRFYQATKAAR